MGWASILASLALLTSLGRLSPVLAEGVEGVRFQVIASHIKVNYNLVGEGNYAVELWIFTQGPKPISLQARTVRGDVGAKVGAGAGKEIVWEVLADLPNGIDSEEVVFEVRARRQSSKRWVWWGLGSGALGLGAAVVALLPKDEPKGTIEINVADPPE